MFKSSDTADNVKAKDEKPIKKPKGNGKKKSNPFANALKK